ncbi:MAG TPA: efflux RND transporter periplasmic adaptor subunit [Candidatus Methylomirabilis sp.]|nr:efflux RND transporter periplasmic adaptor subunit [Candidatus Methylomirabilis sp.]
MRQRRVQDPDFHTGCIRRRPGHLSWSLLILAVLAGACSREDKAVAVPKGPAARPAVRITAAVVEARPVERTVELVGTLRPQEEITVSNENPGTVERILVDLGDRVTAGQLLVRLDPRDARYAFDQAQATLASAKKALDRARANLAASQANVRRARAVLENAQVNRRRFEELFAEGAVSASQRDAAATDADVALASLGAAEGQLESDREAIGVAEATIAQAEAALQTAHKRQKDAEIRAPMAGEVQKRHVSVGETIKEKTPLLILVRTESLKLGGEVPERFAREVRTGQTVRVTTDATAGRQFPGRVVRIAPMVNPETRSFAIEASIPNPDSALKAGAFAKAEVRVRQDSGVPFVPEEAVVNFAGITKVFVIANGTVAERSIRLGARQDGMVEVLEGVKLGEQVAASNLGQLSQGQPVAVEVPVKK